nr:MAG TPA: hypothetical protein [Caudoviricetes sp.]
MIDLDNFNNLCDDFLKDHSNHVPVVIDSVDDEYMTILLYGLVCALKRFSNSEKSIADIGKIHNVCKSMFKLEYDRYLDTTDLKLLTSASRIVFNFTVIEVPRVYAVHRPNNNIYIQINPAISNREIDLKKNSINLILSGLDLFESYILVKYVEMGGSVIIGKRKENKNV